MATRTGMSVAGLIVAIMVAWSGTGSAQTARNAAGGGATASAKHNVAPVTAIAFVRSVDPATKEAKTSEAKITIVGRTDDKLVFVPGELAVGIRRELTIKDIEQIFFEIKVEFGKLELASRKQDWDACIKWLWSGVQPLFPYLDAPNNNGSEYALQLGDCMIRSAELKARKAGTDAEKTAVEELYKKAYAVLRYVTRAEWSKDSILAALKACRCLLALQKPKTAREQWEKIVEPVPGDGAYGLYWLVKAELEAQKGDYRLAMDGAVKSLCFENKDIDTFPDALAMSARCYEELQEWHRARDVYYEIARVFPNTDWAGNSTERLKFIMARGFTKQDEKAPIETVFFALKEDMNKQVTDLLEGRADDSAKKRSTMKTPTKKTTIQEQIKDELEGGKEGLAPPDAAPPPKALPPAAKPVDKPSDKPAGKTTGQSKKDDKKGAKK
ncbi:MAG: tetratricopeptide repeat protein [Verrucomicrobiota bacterium]|nr:tetratricopeptide repeat protein [Verrucomicrobiota bacterium]